MSIFNPGNHITTEYVEEIQEICGLDGDGVKKIQIIIEERDVIISGDDPDDWPARYVMVPGDVKCQGVVGVGGNPTCNAPAQDPPNFCEGGLLTGICNMSEEGEIKEHIQHVYNAFEKMGSGGCETSKLADFVGSYDCAYAKVYLKWKLRCLTADPAGLDPVTDELTHEGVTEPCPVKPPDIPVKCVPIAEPRKIKMGSAVANCSQCRDACNADEKPACINCAQFNKGRGCYCCPAPIPDNCTPGAGFYELTGQYSGYASRGCNGLSWQYFTQVEPPKTVKDIVRYATNKYTTQPGYYGPKIDGSPPTPPNPFRNYDADGAYNEIIEWLSKMNREALTGAMGALKDNPEFKTAYQKCQKLPDCTHSVLEITEVQVDFLKMDADGQGGCGGTAEDPNDGGIGIIQPGPNINPLPDLDEDL